MTLGCETQTSDLRPQTSDLETKPLRLTVVIAVAAGTLVSTERLALTVRPDRVAARA